MAKITKKPTNKKKTCTKEDIKQKLTKAYDLLDELTKDVTKTLKITNIENSNQG